MKITRQEMEDLRVRTPPSQHLRPVQNIQNATRFLDQAVVATKHLTGLPEWDVFLQRVQALIESERNTLSVMADSLAIANMTSEQILQGQRHMLAAKNRIEAWEMVLALPGDILGSAPKIQTPAA